MLLSIVILSYNRPDQIKKILDGMRNTPSADFNLIIKDDCSPKQREIQDIVEAYKETLSFEVVFYKNKTNLGYDRNLLDAFKIASSDYVFLLSDDDYINGIHIVDLLKTLSKKEYKVYFTPYNQSGKINRFNIRPYQLNRFHDVIYNSILFSGLIFDRESVLCLPKDEDFLSNCIYTQVYLSSLIIFNEGKFGEVTSKFLYLGGDGENFFGKNQSAINKDLLQDRSSVTSNFKYQNLLINVVNRISELTHPSVLKNFRVEYNRRLVSYLLRIRSLGLNNYRNLTDYIYESKVDIPWYVKISMKALILIPGEISAFYYKIAVRLLKKSG